MEGCLSEFSADTLKYFSWAKPYAIPYYKVVPGNNSEVFNIPTSVKLDDDLKSRIQQLADIRHRSSHWIMCEAIRDYVEREEAREIQIRLD